MGETKAFLAVGEEAARGTKESTTVGFIAVKDFTIPQPDFGAVKREEFRGEDTLLGHTLERRLMRKWEGLEVVMPAFTEAGTTTGMFGTILKHFFGKAISAQNAATGQYAHMMYPVSDMFATANLGAKALTFNMNFMEGGTLRNYPFSGGRISKISIAQETGEPLIITATAMGQKLEAIEAGLSSPVYPAENLRLDYPNLTLLQGATVTRTGTAPDYTDITSSGVQIKPDSITIEVERGMEDKAVLDGNDYPTKTNIGILEGKLTLTIDWEDPASGFSSVDEFNSWLAGVSTTNFLLTWNTGTAAGTGDNHSFIVDIPEANRLGGVPEIVRDGDPAVTLEFDFHFNATTEYALGILLKNTSTAV